MYSNNCWPVQSEPAEPMIVAAISARMAMGISCGAIKITGFFEANAENNANIKDATNRMPIPWGK